MSETKLSSAVVRREQVIRSAITVFSADGYFGAPISAVAAHAKISPAYVFKLFPGKTTLFIAALEECYNRIVAALQAGADAAGATSPADVLDAMSGAYADLIADRELLMLQVHAQAATVDPDVQVAVQSGLKQITEFVSSRSGAPASDVQRFMAYGQLCHLVVTAGLESLPAEWAATLTDGIRHSTPQGGDPS